MTKQQQAYIIRITSEFMQAEDQVLTFSERLPH